MKITDLSTPAFLVDLMQVEANTSCMIKRALQNGVRLRPHVKTHKTVEGARLQLGDQFDAITVSTLAEARYLLKAGFRDQTYAVPIAPQKLPQVADLIEAGGRINILVDSPEAVEAARRQAESRGLQFGVFLKVDCGLHRAGVDPDSDEGLRVARMISDSTGLASLKYFRPRLKVSIDQPCVFCHSLVMESSSAPNFSAR